MFKHIVYLLGVNIIVNQCFAQEKSMTRVIPKEYGDVSGMVVDRETGKPIPAISVWVYDKYGDMITAAPTNMDGKYNMQYRPIQTGKYYFCVPSNEWGTKGRYLKQFYNGAQSWRSAEIVKVERDKKLSNVDFYLEKGGVLSGSIKSEGLPVVDSVSITVYDAHKIGGVEGLETNYKIVTDSTGAYTIRGVRTGKCKIYISPKHYVAFFYGQSSRWDSASIVGIESVTKGIDVSVRKGSKISGYVFSEKTREPVSNVEIYCSAGGDWSPYVTDSAGYFEFTNLDTGKYTLNVHMRYRTESPYANQYYKQSATYKGADLIELKAGQEVSDIKIYLKEGGKIPITVVDENGTPIEDGKSISIIPQGESRNASSWGISGSTFEYPNVFPGRYTIHISFFDERAAGISYGSVYYKDANRFEDASFVEVKGGYKSNPVTVKMREGGWIQGFIKHNEDAVDGDSTRVTVLAYDSGAGDLIGWGWNTFCGGYKVKSLPIGTYKVAVLSNNSNFAIQYYGGGGTFYDAKAKAVEVKKGKPEFDTNINIINANSSVSGKVIINKNENPKLPVMVCAYDQTGHIVQETYIKKGKYKLRNLRSGKYAIRTVSEKGYKDKWYGDVNLSGSDDFDNRHYFVRIPKDVGWINLNEGEASSGINFFLEEAGSNN